MHPRIRFTGSEYRTIDLRCQRYFGFRVHPKAPLEALRLLLSLSDNPIPPHRPKAGLLVPHSYISCTYINRSIESLRYHFPAPADGVWKQCFLYPNGSRRGVPRRTYGYHFWDPAYYEGNCHMKKLQPGNPGIHIGEIPPDEWMLATCPTLLDYLTNTKYDDGTPRTTSTMTIFVDQGAFKVSVNDRDAEASLYSSAACLLDALASTEKRLNGDQTDWRYWGKGKRKK